MESKRTRWMGAIAVALVLGLGGGHAVARSAPSERAGTAGERLAFESISPERVLDTRKGIGAPQEKVAARASIDLVVTDVAGVPSDAVAVVMNVTATGATAESHLTIWPAGGSKPSASSLNFGPGVTVPNLVTVRVGAGGAISIFNNAGSVDVIADVAGYYQLHDHDDRYYTRSDADAARAADQATVDALATQVSALDAEVLALEAEIDGLVARLDAAEAAIADTYSHSEVDELLDGRFGGVLLDHVTQGNTSPSGHSAGFDDWLTINDPNPPQPGVSLHSSSSAGSVEVRLEGKTYDPCIELRVVVDDVPGPATPIADARVVAPASGAGSHRAYLQARRGAGSCSDGRFNFDELTFLLRG